MRKSGKDSCPPRDKTLIDYELVLLKVAERAGHAHVDSLRSYLTLARKRRIRRGTEADPVTLQQQISALKQELAVLEARIKNERMNKRLLQNRRGNIG